MQDIGGVRAIVGSIEQVRELQAAYKSSRFKHQLVSEKDYIAEPKCDGYRSVHLVFRYVNKRAPDYNGLSVEMQIRTKLQHAWATAVETMGTFLGQALKARQGERQWLQFFEITGSAFAYLEHSPLVPHYDRLSRRDTFDRVAEAETRLGVRPKLRGFTIAADAITTGKSPGSYHLIILKFRQQVCRDSPLLQNALAKGDG